MADTTFVDDSTVIYASWLNDINDFFYTLFNSATTAANARTALGLGTIATQAANNVSITGGTITGITDIAVADGGTGASTALAARLSLGAVGNLTGIQVLTSSGTYTPTAGTKRIFVEAQGPGGGGGGSGSTDSWVGGGGAEGGYVAKLITSVAASYTITIPAGGTGGTATGNGGNASNTVFTDGAGLTLTAGGGQGGPVGGVATTPGAGGTATGGDINIVGAQALGSNTASSTFSFGWGARSKFGRGGTASTPGSGGVAANGYGAGGAAGFRSTTTSRAGGAGSDGLIVVWEYS